jgi:hypothetical protein
MKKRILIATILCCLSLALFAQKGTNILQPSVQVSRPTSALLEFTNIGYGGAIKWMHGFGEKKQQVTLEAGYNRFPVKKLPESVDIVYTAIPVYIGYRYIANKISLEAQGGTSINMIDGKNSTTSASEHRVNLGLGLGIGYLIKNFEIAARFQVTDPRGKTNDPTFLGIRLAYNFSL